MECASIDSSFCMAEHKQKAIAGRLTEFTGNGFTSFYESELTVIFRWKCARVGLQLEGRWHFPSGKDLCRMRDGKWCVASFFTKSKREAPRAKDRNYVWVIQVCLIL